MNMNLGHNDSINYSCLKSARKTNFVSIMNQILILKAPILYKYPFYKQGFSNPVIKQGEPRLLHHTYILIVMGGINFLRYTLRE